MAPTRQAEDLQLPAAATTRSNDGMPPDPAATRKSGTQIPARTGAAHRAEKRNTTPKEQPETHTGRGKIQSPTQQAETRRKLKKTPRQTNAAPTTPTPNRSPDQRLAKQPCITCQLHTPARTHVHGNGGQNPKTVSKSKANRLIGATASRALQIRRIRHIVQHIQNLK